VLKWAWENGCPWSKVDVFRMAAEDEGELAVLKWLGEKGCRVENTHQTHQQEDRY